MTMLYDIVSVDTIAQMTYEQKIDFMSEIILTGRYDYFHKFKDIFGSDIREHITSTHILEMLPMIIEPKFFEYIITNYEFEQGQHFFYNYAKHSESKVVRELVYNYFVDNYSYIMLDNMSKYEELLQK